MVVNNYEHGSRQNTLRIGRNLNRMPKRNETTETSQYAQMGMAALLPGMVHMLEIMQQQVDDFRTQLAALQGGAVLQKAKPGRPPNAAKRRGGAMGWSSDPEERKAEMKRRMKVAAQKKGQAVKSSKLSEERKAQWAALSPAKRKARLKAMIAGREKKQRQTVREAKQQQPVVHLERAS